ncbi:PAS domain-containing protein [Streptomyces oceani]|uniref:PAS domain S-box protein n=1 Tax=Streptomyces oceani TaxID=1075402 RepID=A0A1E7JWG6_9ACTN|nr:PAS domain-containing protein [Streptomyces oceani]OEU96004.1 hypothetical protein AN216_23080 [Streptomyces oceani]
MRLQGGSTVVSRPSRGAARLAAILDALPDALLLVNCNGTVVNANTIALEAFETPGTALVGRGLLDLLPEFDSKRIPGSMRRPDEDEGEVRTKPTRMSARRTDGSTFPVEVTSANLADGRMSYESPFEAAWADHGASGHSSGGGSHYTGDELLMLVVRDLTGTLDTEAELARQQRQTEMILRAAAEGVVGVDTDGRIVLVNPSAAQILGYRASDLGGQQLHPLLHHSRADGTQLPYNETPLSDTLGSGRKHRVRAGQVLWSKDGQPVPVDMTTAPVRDGEQLVGAVLTFTDRRPQEALKERNEALREQNGQLVSVLDEALRAPLEQLGGELSALAADPAGQLWPEANRVLHHLSAGYARMTTLVSNVLNYQQLAAGDEKLRIERVSLDAVVSSGVDAAVELIGPGRAQFAVHAPPIEAEIDPERLVIALAQLIADVAGVDATGNTPIPAAGGDSTIVVAAAQRGEVVRIEVRGPYPGGSRVHEPIARGIVRRHGGVLQTHEVPGAGGSAYVLEVPRIVSEGVAADHAGHVGAGGPGTAGSGIAGDTTGSGTGVGHGAVGSGTDGSGTNVGAGMGTTVMPVPDQPVRGTDQALMSASGTVATDDTTSGQFAGQASHGAGLGLPGGDDWPSAGVPQPSDQPSAPDQPLAPDASGPSEAHPGAMEPPPAGDRPSPTGRRRRAAAPYGEHSGEYGQLEPVAPERPDAQPRLPEGTGAEPVPPTGLDQGAPAGTYGPESVPGEGEQAAGGTVRRPLAAGPGVAGGAGGAGGAGTEGTPPSGTTPGPAGRRPRRALGNRAALPPAEEPGEVAPSTGSEPPASAPAVPDSPDGTGEPHGTGEPDASVRDGQPVQPQQQPGTGRHGRHAPTAEQHEQHAQQEQTQQQQAPPHGELPPAGEGTAEHAPAPGGRRARRLAAARARAEEQARGQGSSGQPLALPAHGGPPEGLPAQSLPQEPEQQGVPASPRPPGEPSFDGAGALPASADTQQGAPGAGLLPAQRHPDGSQPGTLPPAVPGPEGGFPGAPTSSGPAVAGGPGPLPEASGPPHPAEPGPGTGAVTDPRIANASLANGHPAAEETAPPGADQQNGISVRTLGQGVPFTGSPPEQGGDAAQSQGHLAPATAIPSTPSSPTPPPGPGRRRRLASPGQDEAEAPQEGGPAGHGGPGQPQPGAPAPQAQHAPPQQQPPQHRQPQPPAREFAIGAPDVGAAEGPEPLDGPNGAVDVTATNGPGTPAHSVDAELPPEPLDNPRRLLVWPEPDVSTQQELSERGYRPVIVNSREEVDAQIAAFPAALFVDPLTGPITRTALQSLRQAAIAAEVPVLVTAGLGQATREAAYGADPAVLLKALAPRDSEQHPPRVLLIEENTAIAGAFSSTLERRGMQVAHAASDADAVTIAAQARPNLVVMDLMQVRRRRAGILDWLQINGLLHTTPFVVYTSADIDPAGLPRLATGETVLFLAERSTSAEVQSRIVDLLTKIGGA